MHQSLLRGAPVEMDARSVASGLAPPSAGLLPFRLCERFGAGVVLVSEQQLRAAVASLFSAGRLPFRLCARFGAGVVLVSEQQLRAAVASLFSAGLVVEPSGAAAFAAIANDRIPELEGGAWSACSAEGTSGRKNSPTSENAREEGLKLGKTPLN
ncbi:unnamed protein product, partial [Menidia menidia]